MADHFILCLVFLSLLAFSVSGQVFWSVNCGASDTYIDENLISWMPDATLLSNGLARVVQPSKSLSDKVLDSLRVFTSRKKNCYFTQVTKGEKLLVRASFYYGNYDGLSSPPTFDLHFDGNLWTTVQTSVDGLNVLETTYVAKGDSISVCVAQTKPGQFPFMSSLEVRSVDSDVYKVLDENRALFLISRYSYGASKVLRFPQDRYDRIWLPIIVRTKKVTNDAIFVDSTGPNNPPSGIFQNALTVDSTADRLYLATVPPLLTPVYLTWYFSEVSNLDITGETRAFRFYKNTAGSIPSSFSQPFSPPYGSMVEREIYNYTVLSTTNISLIAEMSSDLPPIVNAVEVFIISGELTDGTDSNDVEALALLQKTFDVLGEWSGDPCLPAPYSWDWLSCSNETRPRITSLFLDGFQLSGSLPDISSMDALEIIDLHNNSFDGEIPSFLGTMTNLQQLNLADNDFSGPIPTSLSKNNKLKLDVTGNPSMCASGKSCSSSPGTINSPPGSTTNSSPGSTTLSRSKKKKRSMLPIILGIAIPIFFLFWVALGVFIILRKKKKPFEVNMPIATGHTTEGANGNYGGGAIGNSNGVHNTGGETVNEITGNPVPQTLRSSPPVVNNSGQTSNIHGQTRVQNNN